METKGKKRQKSAEKDCVYEEERTFQYVAKEDERGVKTQYS